jgi:very-short-patch-repair endonuclease
VDVDAVRRVAGRQHGLITRGQAEQIGMGRRAWYSAQASGRLVVVAPRVASLPGSPRSPEQLILAAVLSAGPGAMASHRSAAHLWGVESMPSTQVDITFAERARTSAIPWVRVHTPTDLEDLRPVRRAGIPATNPLRVLVDLGQVAPEAVPRALQGFLFDGIVSRSAVEETLRRHSRPGRHGVVVLRAAVAAWDIDGRPPDSVLELRMSALLAAHGLPSATFHARILGHEVDFALEHARVVLECDGWDTHGRDRRQFERDRARDATLIAAGWVVLRFTWIQITRRPAWVASIIRRTVVTRRSA